MMQLEMIIKDIVICSIVLCVGVFMIWFEQKKKTMNFYKSITRSLYRENDPTSKTDDQKKHSKPQSVKWQKGVFQVDFYFKEMILLSSILDEKDIARAKYSEGTSVEAIVDWEASNNVILPDKYKYFLTLANGFRYRMEEIFPLERIQKLKIPKEFKGYYWIGEFIGDGSLLLTDGKGELYYGDHVRGIEKGYFEGFLEKSFLSQMEQDLIDESVLDNSNKLCKIVGFVTGVGYYDIKYGDYYYKLQEITDEVNADSLYLAPVSFKDIGIGGGEAYDMTGSNKSTRIVMQRYRNIIRVIYGNKTITGLLTGVYLDDHFTSRYIYVHTDDGYKLFCSLDGCDIEILAKNRI